jgi:hypothetical protein
MQREDKDIERKARLEQLAPRENHLEDDSGN